MDSFNANTNTQTSGPQAYMKPAANEDSRNVTKKQTRAPKGTSISNVRDKVNVSNVLDAETLAEHQEFGLIGDEGEDGEGADHESDSDLSLRSESDMSFYYFHI